ncbi:MAG TPA: tetratricopeptide repeat protein [Candidatus Methylomirabilis sp.]|nr:tetratricopeptide repeat protein [Candidatus Methylomirabilis sp.]
MSLRPALLLALLFGLLVAYLTALNPAGVHIPPVGGPAYAIPLLLLLLGTFLVGGTLGFVLGMFRDVARSYRDHWRTRRARQGETLDQLYHHGVDAQRAGRAVEATQAYEVLRAQPVHIEALIRLGEMARQRGDLPGALEYHLQALQTEESVDALLLVASDYQALGRTDDAVRIYERILARNPEHGIALRGLRDIAAGLGRWREALHAQERLIRVAVREDRVAEEGWLAGIQYELGRALLAAGDVQGAASSLRDALRTQSDFLPAALALGDAHIKAGETREALRVWERALGTGPALPLLSRMERLHRDDGRPDRVIALYQGAATRRPEDIAVAFGLGRAYFELAMLDEAAEQFQKLEVQTPDLSAIHAYLGAILERRGQIRDAFEEYRRALRFPDSFEWPHRCVACGATHPFWVDRCPSCRRWNTSRS